MAMSRDQLRQALLQHGEEPPKSWTKLELRQRLAEISPEGVNYGSKKKERTTLEEKIKELNQAAKKKDSLKQHLASLGIELSGHETCAVLQHRGLRHLLEQTPSEGGDKVGFGKYSSYSYQELKAQVPSYCRWVTTTAREEEGCDFRLRRLAGWLEQTENEELVKPATRVPAGKPVRKEIQNMNEPGQASQATPTEAKETLSAEAKMMKAMLQTMEQMQEEIADLREERPRKKNDRARHSDGEEGATTDSSYLMVRDP